MKVYLAFPDDGEYEVVHVASSLDRARGYIAKNWPGAGSKGWYVVEWELDNSDTLYATPHMLFNVHGGSRR